MNVRVKLKYLVSVKQQAGRGEEEVDFPQGTTLADVAAWLDQQYGVSTTDAQVMATLNGTGWQQQPAGMATQLGDGDVIALFPLLSGG